MKGFVEKVRDFPGAIISHAIPSGDGANGKVPGRIKRGLVPALMAMLAMLGAGAGAAQTWQSRTDDTGGLIYGTAFAPQYSLAFACNTPSPAGRPLMDTGDHETNRNGPFAIWVELGHILVEPRGNAPVLGAVTLIVDGTGYRLPPIQWSDFYGAWQVELSMGDPMFAALVDARTLVLDVGQGAAWQYPLDGLQPALDAAMQACVDGWVQQGLTIPVALNRYWPRMEEPAGPIPVQPMTGAVNALIPVVENHIRAQCGAGFQLDPARLGQADFDRDAVADIVLDWGAVTCDGAIARPYCGAAYCSIDVFLSSRGGQDPVAFLGVGYGLPLAANGLQGIQFGGTAGACARGECDDVFWWDGTQFQQQR
jgi:hypothetical protein